MKLAGLQDGYGDSGLKYRDCEIPKFFRSSPKAAICAHYGLVHLVLLLVVDEAEQLKALLHVLGLK